MFFKRTFSQSIAFLRPLGRPIISQGRNLRRSTAAVKVFLNNNFNKAIPSTHIIGLLAGPIKYSNFPGKFPWPS
jgi:hypothetical protein